MKIIYNPIDSEASSCQRVIYPLMALAKAGKAEVEVINTNDIRSQLRKADLVVLQCVIGPQQHELIDYIHEQGKRVVIDYDDAFDVLPKNLLKRLGYTQKSITENWIKYLQTADLITVPSEALAANIKKHTDKPIKVLPNYLPKHEHELSEDYDPFEEGHELISRDDNSNEIRIMYSCSESHLGDFNYIGPILQQIGETYPQVTILSQGGLEFGYHFWEYKGKSYHGTKTSYGSYYSMLRTYRPHIFIAPLEVTKHNVCRSNLKFLQAGVVKAAFVGSRLTPYKSIDNNVTGFLVASKSEWWSILAKLVEDPKLAKAVGINAYEKVADYLLEDHIDEWEAVYSHVLKK